jgi:hypothetical protein
MGQCRAELAETAEKIASRTFWVAEHDGQLAGMIALVTDATSPELDYFGRARLQRLGVGRALLDARRMPPSWP